MEFHDGSWVPSPSSSAPQDILQKVLDGFSVSLGRRGLLRSRVNQTRDEIFDLFSLFLLSLFS